MDSLNSGVDERDVNRILVKNNGKRYLTLYYVYSDSVLHDDTKHILCFPSIEDMDSFCEKNNLKADDEMLEYDFDSPIGNPIDYRRILDNWNLLNTIAGDFGMYFEGDQRKYTPLYDLLFRLNTPAEPISPTSRVNEKDHQDILKVFKKKDRFLNRFALYIGE